MSFSSPTRGSGSLDRFERVGSSGRKLGSATYSETIYAKQAKKLKKLQSAQHDTTTGTWRCKNCGWDYPNANPQRNQRREHKKICPGSLVGQRWLSFGSGRSIEEETGSHDTSTIVDKPTMSETADRATAKLSLGQKSKSDGANSDGGLAKTSNKVQAPQVLEREFKVDGTPSRKESTSESEIQEVGDAKAGANREQVLSDQSGIVGSVDKRGDLADLGKRQSLYASDSTVSHDPSQDRSDQVDLSAFTNFKFDSASKDFSSGNEEGKDTDMEEPLSLSSQTEADRRLGDQPTPLSPENREKDQAEDLGEGSEQRKSSLAATVTRAEDFEDAEMSSRADEGAQKEKPELLQDCDENQLTLTEDGNAQKQREEMGDGYCGTDAMLTAADGVPRAQEEHVGTEEGTPTRDQDGKDHVKQSYPNAVAGDGMDYEGEDEQQSGQSVRDVGEEVLQNGRTPETENAGGVLKSEREAGNEIGSQSEGLDWESLLDKSAHEQPGEPLGSSTDQHLSPGQDSLNGDRPPPFLHENGVEDEAEDLVEGFEQREPSLKAVVNQGEVTQDSEDVDISFSADQKQREAMTEGSGGTDAMLTAAEGVLKKGEEDVATEEAISTTNEDGEDHVNHSDPNSVAEDGMDYESVGASLSETGSAAEVISEKLSTREGVEAFSGAHRNGDGWDDVISGEDSFGENKMSPLLQDREIDGAGEPFSAEGFKSHGQSDHVVNDSVPTLERAGGVLKSEEEAGNEIGSQREGLDWESPLDKSVHQSLGNSLGSTSADHHLSQDRNWPELVPGLDQMVGGNVDQQQTDQTQKAPLKLSPAEANWDDWDEVIQEVPMLIDGITSKETRHPESSGEGQTPGVESLGGGDMSEAGEEKTGTVLEDESLEGVIATAPAGLPVYIPESEGAGWLIDFGEPSAEPNSGAANGAISAVATLTPKVDAHGVNAIDLLSRHEDGGQEQGASSLESELVNGPEKKSSVLDSDLVAGQHRSGPESSDLSDKYIVESGSIKPAGSVEALKSPPVANNSSAAVNSGQGFEGLNHEKQPDAMATSVGDEANALFRLPKPVRVPRLADNSLPKNRESPENLDLGRTEGRKGVSPDDETPRDESGQGGAENGPLAQSDWGDLEDIRKREYLPSGSRHSSPSFEDAHDAGLTSENESPNGHKAAVKLPLGKGQWADWGDLAKSEYMVLDGPRGESLVFKRASDASGYPFSGKSLRERASSSFEEPDDEGDSPRLRSNRRQPQSFGPMKGAAPPSAVVTSDYSAGSVSFQGFETTKASLPGSSPSKSEAGDKASSVSTHRPLLYRDSRRDYTSEVEDMDVTNEPTNPIVHHHDHNIHEHEDALKYDVVKVLRRQTQYELLCPICGALITKKIVIRKKKRRFISQGDPRWKRDAEITPVEEDGSKTPRSDTSSAIEDARVGWKLGIISCLGYFFTP